MLVCPRGTTIMAANSGPDRISGMPADLENALGKALLTGRRMTRHARGFGVEHRRTEPDQGRRDKYHRRSCPPNASPTSPDSVAAMPATMA